MANLATLLHGSGNPEDTTGLDMVSLHPSSHKRNSLTLNITSLVDYFMIYIHF